MIRFWLFFLKVEPTNFLMGWVQDLMGHMKDFWTFYPKREATGLVLSKEVTWLYLCF